VQSLENYGIKFELRNLQPYGQVSQISRSMNSSVIPVAGSIIRLTGQEETVDQLKGRLLIWLNLPEILSVEETGPRFWGLYNDFVQLLSQLNEVHLTRYFFMIHYYIGLQSSHLCLYIWSYVFSSDFPTKIL
jgi:hypothetical protein